MAKQPDPRRRDRTRPVEVIGIALAIGVFITLGVALGTRNWVLASEFGGVGFIVALVVLAMLLVAASPRYDDKPDDPDDEPHH